MSAKRVADVVGAVLGLALASPILVAAALALRAGDDGPVFFLQERVGRGRRPFVIVKLRTMTAGHVTRLGRVLRELGLDELPQLWNVLVGDMSLVGPRPLTRADVRRLGWEGARFDARWSVRPGLTGLAQVAPARACHGRVSYLLDLAYVRRAGLTLDLRVLALSACVPLLGKRGLRAVLRRPSLSGSRAA